MDIQEKLVVLRENQRRILADYELLLKQYDSEGLTTKNAQLEQELTTCKGRLVELEDRLQSVTQENGKLRISLKEQIMDEKLNILKISAEKIDTYFKTAVGTAENNLVALERQSKIEIDNLRDAATQNLGQEKIVFVGELNEWQAKLAEQIRGYRERISSSNAALAANLKNKFANLENEDLTEETIQKRISQNETEMKIGLNWINKIGILLILFGVGAAAKYAHATWFTDYMKGASFFVLGGVFLAGGEWLYRKGKDVFATGLLGGGVSILYAAVFYSYFLLEIMDIHAGLFLAVLVTLTTVVLSVRYQSKTICSIGLVGGYLPFFSYLLSVGIQDEACYVAMGYLFLLNVVVLGVSFWKKWNTVHYLSMIFHIPALIYLVLVAENPFVSMLYTVLTFATNLLTQLAYPLKYNASMKKVDLQLMAVNTFCSCAIIYGLFAKADWSDYKGVLALVFCLIYIALAKLIERQIPDEKYGALLLYATAMTFAILMIPFQLGIQWMSMGWLVESVILIIYSLKYQLEKIEKVGWVIFGLCLGIFYLGDWANILLGLNHSYLNYKFAAITIGTLVITRAYLIDSKQGGMGKYGNFYNIALKFKYFTIINAWVYLLYMTGEIYTAWVPYGYHFMFYKMALMAMINVAMGYVLCRIPLLYDSVVQGFSITFYTFGILLCMGINLFVPVIGRIPQSNAAEYGAITILILFNILMLLVVKEFLVAIIKSQRVNFEFYPLGIILYLLVNITIILTQQFHLGGGHFVSSLVCLLAALGSLVYGFRYNYIYTRRFGLGLAVFATAKLFLLDLMFLDSLKKIIAYFVFGFVLLGISYLYQRLKARAEEQDNEKNL